MDFGVISWLAVFLAAAAFFALGGLWYGPLFSDVWMRAAGLSEEDAADANLPAVFVATFVLELAGAVGLAAVIGADPTLASGLGTGAAVAGLIIVPTLGVLSLYEQRSVTLWALNSGYNVLGFVVMGAIIGLV